MAWDDLRYLAALADASSASAAARSLGVSTSTVYRRIAILEEEIGGPCIVKGSRPPRFTEAGLALVALARQTASGLQRVSHEVSSEDQALTGVVSMTSVEGFLPYLVEPLHRLAEQHPGLRVDVHLSDTGPSVRRREVDVAIAVMRNPPEGLVGRRLRPIRYGVFGTEAACAHEPRRWIVTGAARAHTAEAAWEREHAGVEAVATNSRNLMVALVRAGVGVAVLPSRLAALDPPLEELEEHRATLQELGREVWLLTHPEVRHKARVRVLFDALCAALVVEPRPDSQF